MDRKQIIEKVAVELDRQLVLSDIKDFLNEYGIKAPLRKREMPMTTYIKDRLVNISDADLKNMAVWLDIIDTSGTETSRPKLFISYSQTNSEHQDWVTHLVEKLDDYDVDILFDRELLPGSNMNVFMEKIADPNINKVLMISNKDYAEKANARRGGVGTEANIIAEEIKKGTKQNKFAAIVLEKDENGDAYLPIYCKSNKYIDFTDSKKNDDSFNELRLWCFDKPLYERPSRKKIFETPVVQDSPPTTYGSWEEREICRAAVKTYFSLKDMPVDSEDNGDFKGFKSAAGYIYTCKIEGNVAVLQWVNGTGEAMSSRATSFEVDGSKLFVTDNIMGGTEAFVKD